MAAPLSAAPRIAIIIDDIGYRRAQDEQVLALPRSIAMAVIPGSPHGSQMAREAVAQQREVLVHLPMEAMHDDAAQFARHDDALHSGDDEQQLRRRLQRALVQVPGATGINNHRGSKLTQTTRSMRWLMHALACQRTLYFIDSYTSADSVALAEARRALVPATRRHVFLDHEPHADAIDAQIERLMDKAEQQGFALAIGHPLPATLIALTDLESRLAARGIELVSPGALVSVRDVTADASAD